MSTGALRDPLKEEFIVAPHETCQSCSNSSGPKFFLTALKGPSNGHRDNIIPKDEEYDSVCQTSPTQVRSWAVWMRRLLMFTNRSQHSSSGRKSFRSLNFRRKAISRQYEDCHRKSCVTCFILCILIILTLELWLAIPRHIYE
ncbi:hypothetical protein BDQ17DRAFT_1106192 [Cyathus striatus]|nr:hypothetical protein BDQ17DRAFT_1106192 [Cyathus striatus]